MNVQAFLNNISFPKSLEELELFLDEFNVEEILTSTETEWTSPKWAVKGDIVFFFHAKTAIQWIAKLETQLKACKCLLSDVDYSSFSSALNRARQLYKKYGGKIFAVGKISGTPFYDKQDGDEVYHWSSRFYAQIDSIHVLNVPIDISEFSDFVFVSRQSAITPVVGSDFDRLKELIASKNKIPQYLRESSATPLPLQKISSENWLDITQAYRRLFALEIQFRRFYVDYFLKVLGEQKKFYSECECIRQGKRTGFADNAIKVNGKLCFVEVKLNVHVEAHLHSQLKKYCQVEEAIIEKGKTLEQNRLWQNSILVIDTADFYLYDFSTDTLTPIQNLDRIHTEADIKNLRNRILPLLH